MMTVSEIVKKKNDCNKYKKFEVGMAVPKSTQTRVVGIITYMVNPYTCFQVTACNILKLLLLFFTYFLIIIWWLAGIRDMQWAN